MIIQIYREELTQELFDYLVNIQCEELHIEYCEKSIFERDMEMSDETGELAPMSWYNKVELDKLGIKYGLQ